MPGRSRIAAASSRTEPGLARDRSLIEHSGFDRPKRPPRAARSVPRARKVLPEAIYLRPGLFSNQRLLLVYPAELGPDKPAPVIRRLKATAHREVCPLAAITLYPAAKSGPDQLTVLRQVWINRWYRRNCIFQSGLCGRCVGEKW